jgi:murein DD-endopeptidase MepM/ murein hydrolase activator NlpD
MAQVSTNLFTNQVESSPGILAGVGGFLAGKFPGLMSGVGAGLKIGGFGAVAAGGIMSMMPSMEKYLVRETGYYQAGVSSMGALGRQGLVDTTRENLTTMTSVGSDATVAAILSGRGVSTGSNLYGSILRQTSNAASYFNQSNEVAASSMEALTGGGSSAALLRRGIFTSNPMTGEVLNESQIFEQLARRFNVTSDMTVEEIQDELRRGFLGANIDSLDMDPAAKERLRMYFLSKGSNSGFAGVDFSSQDSMENWAANAFGAGSRLIDTENAENSFINPMNPAYQMAGSETGLIEDYAGLYGEGFQDAADFIGAAQREMKFFADETNEAGNLLVKFNSALATILGSDIGAGIASGGFVFMGPAMGISAIESYFTGGEDAATGGAGVGDVALGPQLSAPTIGNVTAGYGKAGPEFIDGTHNGIDYGVPIGTDVRAAYDGTVQTVKNNTAERSYGLHIVLDHGGGWTTTYAHLSEALVAAGDSVRKNQLIGKSGKSGTTDPHLHFEVKKHGKDIPPSQFNPSAAGGAGASDMGMLWGGSTASGGYGTGSGVLPSSAGGGGGASAARVVSPSRGSSGAPQVTINLTVANASEEEARRFARIVKEQIEEDTFVNRMGVR